MSVTLLAAALSNWSGVPVTEWVRAPRLGGTDSLVLGAAGVCSAIKTPQASRNRGPQGVSAQLLNPPESLGPGFLS